MQGHTNDKKKTITTSEENAALYPNMPNIIIQPQSLYTRITVVIPEYIRKVHHYDPEKVQGQCIRYLTPTLVGGGWLPP